MNSKLLIGLVVLVAGVGVGWYFLKGSSTTPQTASDTQVYQPTPTPTQETVDTSLIGSSGLVGTSATAGGEGVMVLETSTVTYTDSGFSPNIITVKKGTTVKFVNQGTGSMWVASAVHPTHQLLPGFDQLKSVLKGSTYEYTFEKVGTWKYHNHVNASNTGSVVVTE